MNQRFNLSSNCTYISANRCIVKIIFWFDRQIYNITFTSDQLNDQNLIDNKHFIMIQIINKQFFSYDIDHICKDADDCSRIYAEEKVHDLIKRSYNLKKIYSDLQRILYDKNSLSENLACFDMNDAVRQCTIPGMSGSCQIVDDLIKHKIHKRLCQHGSQESANVNIYDTGNSALMTVKCNRMLCNGPLTIAAVKKILQRHNITDNNGRIPGNCSQILLNLYLFILTIFLSFRIK